MDRPGFESRRQKIESEGSRQQAGGSKQRAKGKEQRSETADRRLKTANSKVAFRSHSSRHPSSVLGCTRFALSAMRFALYGQLSVVSCPVVGTLSWFSLKAENVLYKLWALGEEAGNLPCRLSIRLR